MTMMDDLDWLSSNVLAEMQLFYQPPKTMTGVTPKDTAANIAKYVEGWCTAVLTFTRDRHKILAAWQHIQANRTKLYWPSPAEFIQAIKSLRHEREELAELSALPPPPSGERIGPEIGKIMAQLVVTPLGRLIVAERLANYLSDDVRHHRVNESADVTEVLLARYRKSAGDYAAAVQSAATSDFAMRETCLKMAQSLDDKARRINDYWRNFLNQRAAA